MAAGIQARKPETPSPRPRFLVFVLIPHPPSCPLRAGVAAFGLANLNHIHRLSQHAMGVRQGIIQAGAFFQPAFIQWPLTHQAAGKLTAFPANWSDGVVE